MLASLAGSPISDAWGSWMFVLWFLTLLLLIFPILDVLAGLTTGFVCGLVFRNLRLWHGVGIGLLAGVGYGVMRLTLSDNTSSDQFFMAVAAIGIVSGGTVLACWFISRQRRRKEVAT